MPVLSYGTPGVLLCSENEKETPKKVSLMEQNSTLTEQRTFTLHYQAATFVGGQRIYVRRSALQNR